MFPFIRQHDNMQCGAACLGMICRYYGYNVSLQQLSEVCCPTSEGVSLLGLTKSACIIGFDAFACKVTVSSLMENKSPCILHWNQNHFVVLYKVRRGYFYIADPSKGHYRCKQKEFLEHWIGRSSSLAEDSGYALLMRPSEKMENIVSKYVEQRKTPSFGVLSHYLSEYRKHLAVVLLGLFTGCLLQLILPFLTQSIVDIGIRNNDISFIWLVLLGELMIVVGRTASDFIRRWLLLHISMRINISLVSDFFIKLLKLPMSFFDSKLMGDLLQRINDHSRVQSFLTNQVVGVLFTFLSFIVFGIVLLVYDYLIFSVFVVGSICYGLWIVRFMRRRKVLDYELFEQQAINQNKTYQFITTMQEIKLQDCERRRRWEWEDTQAELFAVQMKSLKLQQSQEAGCIFINEINNITITVLAASAVINGHMTLGAMLAVQYIIGQLNSPVEQLMSFIYSLQDVKISLERINEIHDGKNEELAENRCTDFNEEKTIKIEHADFKYNKYALKNTLDDVSIAIPEGKITAIVGASGSGKTTLVKLLLGYYKLNSGCIVISGRKIDEYNLKWWRRQCGVVMQDGVIFSESIARNIAVADGEIDVERLENAARIANIHDYIMSLPHKYDTIIGQDGVGFSQGQKQRILIARAVYKDPDFIFLDEATNALDAKNEKCIVENLNRFYKGRTVVVVAHRLSTVRNADQIIVLDEGRVKEQGNHDELIGLKGSYYNLVKNQLELGN